MEIGKIKRLLEVETIDAPVPTVVPSQEPVETAAHEPDPAAPRDGYAARSHVHPPDGEGPTKHRDARSTPNPKGGKTRHPSR